MRRFLVIWATFLVLVLVLAVVSVLTGLDYGNMVAGAALWTALSTAYDNE